MSILSKRGQKQERMFALMEQYRKSGLTQPEFCRQIPLNLSTFHFWLKKYRQAKLSLQEPTRNFIPLSLAIPDRNPALLLDRCSIRFPNGVIIRLSGAIEPEALLHLIHGRVN